MTYTLEKGAGFLCCYDGLLQKIQAALQCCFSLQKPSKKEKKPHILSCPKFLMEERRGVFSSLRWAFARGANKDLTPPAAGPLQELTERETKQLFAHPNPS